MHRLVTAICGVRPSVQDHGWKTHSEYPKPPDTKMPAYMRAGFQKTKRGKVCDCSLDKRAPTHAPHANKKDGLSKPNIMLDLSNIGDAQRSSR